MNDEKQTQYAIVSQANWHVPRVDKNGRPYTSVGFRAPPSMKEAENWPGTYIVWVKTSEQPPTMWGHGTFAEVDGHMLMVASDFDTSG